jgi:hypothetical protein
MRIRLLLLFLFFALNLNAINPGPLAVKGVLDLRELKDSDHFIIKLNGEWEFYWNKKLVPQDFLTADYKPDYYGNVPSYWTDYRSESFKTEKFGFATYRLTILFPIGFKSPLAIDLPVFDSSYDIFIDGKYFGGNGTPGKTADQTKPEYKRNFFRIIPASDTLSLIINVSNFHHRRGGFWLPVKLGTFTEVQKQLANSWATDWSVISLLLGFSIFFLLFFILNPSEKLLGSFSMATIGLAVRPLVTSHYLIYNLIDISWTWVVRFEYFSLFLVIIGWSWFVENLYPSIPSKAVAWFITIFFFVVFCLTLFLPVSIFSYATLAYYPLMILLISYLKVFLVF